MVNIRKYYAKDLCEKYQLTLIKEIGKKLNVLDSDGLEHLILRDQLARGHSKIGIKSAVNKNEYFLTNLRKRFPDIDDFCDFQNSIILKLSNTQQ